MPRFDLDKAGSSTLTDHVVGQHSLELGWIPCQLIHGFGRYFSECPVAGSKDSKGLRAIERFGQSCFRKQSAESAELWRA